MTVRFVRVPADIEIAPTLTWKFREGLEYLIDTAMDFQKPLSRVRQAERLVKAFEDAAEGDVREIREEDWAELTKVVESGSAQWGSWTQLNPDGSRTPIQIGARRFLGFSNAVTDASHEPPPK